MSTLRVDTVQSVAGVERFLSHAWVNFNGTGVIAIRQDGNVTSLTDGGNGVYTVNFTSAITDSSFAAIASSNGARAVIATTTFLTTSVNIECRIETGVLTDQSIINVSVVR
jgi:hypothetical protein